MFHRSDGRIIPAYAGSTLYSHFGSKGIWDHPRIRGEHPGHADRPASTGGSSPHTRGARFQRRKTHPCCRIIPAYAGSTHPRLAPVAGRGDHPRIRGEHPDIARRARTCPGSSPHTRGAPGFSLFPRMESRIIPAYAGSTCGSIKWIPAPWDHPRIRGEHLLDGRGKPRNEGSSPHTRGALHSRARRVQEHGIIPAYAGSTPRPGAGQSPAADHPRIRGEHERVSDVSGARAGSSPHTRGALSERGDIGVGRGIIPAYAGSTSEAPCTSPAPGDHPRIRGEHLPQTSCIADKQGSSPHTRGARRRRGARHRRPGIIPAYAGSTWSTSRRRCSASDHPRIRGEHWARWNASVGDAGSSPHTRGAQRERRALRNPFGIIPAYAGSTPTGATTP